MRELNGSRHGGDAVTPELTSVQLRDALRTLISISRTSDSTRRQLLTYHNHRPYSATSSAHSPSLTHPAATNTTATVIDLTGETDTQGEHGAATAISNSRSSNNNNNNNNNHVDVGEANDSKYDDDDADEDDEAMSAAQSVASLPLCLQVSV